MIIYNIAMIIGGKNFMIINIPDSKVHLRRMTLFFIKTPYILVLFAVPAEQVYPINIKIFLE